MNSRQRLRHNKIQRHNLLLLLTDPRIKVLAAEQGDLRDEETRGSAACGLLGLPRDQEATGSSELEEPTRKQREPLICMVRSNKPTTLKE